MKNTAERKVERKRARTTNTIDGCTTLRGRHESTWLSAMWERRWSKVGICCNQPGKMQQDDDAMNIQ